MNRILVPIALFLFIPLFGLLLPFVYPEQPSNIELQAANTIGHLWNYVLQG